MSSRHVFAAVLVVLLAVPAAALAQGPSDEDAMRRADGSSLATCRCTSFPTAGGSSARSITGT